MGKVKPPVIGNIVEVYKIGNTTIKICDDSYRDKTPEELKKVEQRIMKVCWDIVRAARAQGKDI